MVAQFLRGYKGGFDFVTVMNMDSRLFFTYYDNLTRINKFNVGEYVEGLHEKDSGTPSNKELKSIKKHGNQSGGPTNGLNN